jgi:hypothetical protein
MTCLVRRAPRIGHGAGQVGQDLRLEGIVVDRCGGVRLQASLSALGLAQGLLELVAQRLELILVASHQGLDYFDGENLDDVGSHG